MDPADVASVKALKETKPRTVGGLCKLLGFISYYRQYIKDFSRLAKPLYALLSSAVDTSKQATKTRRKTPLGAQQINWTKEHQERFNLLIDLLMQPGVMAYSDFKKPFVLHTDTSSKGLGAVLYQKQGGNQER